MAEQLSSTKLDWDVLQEERQAVLASWETGNEVDLEEAVQFHHELPPEKNFARKLTQAKNAGLTLAQPRAGVADLRSHVELLRYLSTEGEADLLPTTIDSYTRQNRYEEAQRGLDESRREGRSLLNGFPAVNHGVAKLPHSNRRVGPAPSGQARHSGCAAVGRNNFGGRVYCV